MSPPRPGGPVPSPRQLAWQELRLYGFVHFTVNTFTDREWGYGDESPDCFAPSDFDADQIVETARDGGLAGLILTCKHHDGFCLWPTSTTAHSVAASSWRGGGGDVVGDIGRACERHGLKFGVYLSPWDRHAAAYGTPAYVETYRSQLRELLTEYGPVFEVWHDGANGGDGYYGGARETRTIDKTTYYDWPGTWDLVRRLQPDAVIFSDVGPDVRWVGNEAGRGAETTWLTMRGAVGSPGDVPVEDLAEGHEDGDAWRPPEMDVSIRPGWFYHAAENDRVKTVSELVEIYEHSVGRSGALLLNLPPDRRGQIHPVDVERLRGLRGALEATYGVDLAAGATATASGSRGPQWGPAGVLDGRGDTFWCLADETTSGWVQLDLPAPRTFDRVLCEEAIHLGQRVRRWHVEVEGDDGGWRRLGEATTIGARRILATEPVTTQRVRLHVDAARACPAMRRLSLHLRKPG